MSGSYIPLLVFGFESVGEVRPGRFVAFAQTANSRPSRPGSPILQEGALPGRARVSPRPRRRDGADLARRGILDTVRTSSPPQQVHGNP